MTSDDQNKILMAGPFPPPVYGMSTTNAAVSKSLVALGADVLVLNTSAPSLDRSPIARLGRLPRVLGGLRHLLCEQAFQGKILYLSISGGFGQVYEITFLLLGRLRRMRIFLRHCSFAYLDKPSWLARILVKAAGSDAVHVTQSQGMADRLKALYGAEKVVPISNAVLYPKSPLAVRPRETLRILGFLSNLSTDKGVFEFLDLLAAAAEKGLPLNAKIAGQFQDEPTKLRVMNRLRALRNVQHVGGVYGAEKDRFFDDIDVFIFPTRYRNETEAKVNHEAMSRGIPVIAYGRGCIPEIVGADCGLVIDPAEPFVPAALAKLESWLADPEGFEAASTAAAARFARTYDENAARWRALLEDIVGAHPGGAQCQRERS